MKSNILADTDSLLITADLDDSDDPTYELFFNRGVMIMMDSEDWTDFIAAVNQAEAERKRRVN